MSRCITPCRLPVYSSTPMIQIFFIYLHRFSLYSKSDTKNLQCVFKSYPCILAFPHSFLCIPKFCFSLEKALKRFLLQIGILRYLFLVIWIQNSNWFINYIKRNSKSPELGSLTIGKSRSKLSNTDVAMRIQLSKKLDSLYLFECLSGRLLWQGRILVIESGV